MMDPCSSNTLPAGHGALRMTTIDPPTRAEEDRALVGQQISFPLLSFSYPLKLIVSRPYRNDLHKLQIGLVYILNYGGGLLSGDQLALDIQLDDRCQLLCLSQGSTKVFKQKDSPTNRFSSAPNRDSLYPSSQTTITPTGTSDVSRQNITAKIGSNATLLMLPSYVTCFRDSSFVQKQIYHLQDHSSSLVCLDWFTSGRSLSTRLPNHQNETNQNESWTFKKFQSFIEVYISSNRIVRENLILLRDQHHPTQDHFTLYANLYLVCSSDNSKLIKTLDRLKELDRNSNKTRRQHPQSSAKMKEEQQSQLLWCFSELIHHPEPEITPAIHPALPDHQPATPKPNVRTAIIRIGSHSSILARDWLEKNLADLQEIIGPEFYRNCF